MRGKWANNTPGKPTSGKSKVIAQEIEKAYEDGWSIKYAAKQLQYNRKTVKAHYKELREKFMEDLHSDFSTFQREQKENCIADLDGILDRLKNEIKVLDDKVEANIDDEMEYEWRKYRLELIDRISTLSQQRADIAMRPTIDVSLEKMVEERLAEVEQIESKKPTSPK